LIYRPLRCLPLFPYTTLFRSQSVAALALAEAVRELCDEADACRRERMPARDRAAVRVQALVVGRDSHAVAPGQHLDRERLESLRSEEHTSGLQSLTNIRCPPL